ncbi:isoamylase early set domain-containing protein [Fundidesulfovibrio putealis]|uniref:isoamylase early set domain-containing protein n=1 Tax=Fundidesulfovibrio putealis TaxID=270496 RepID=UPI0006884E71|nr:isoamylase early set domain-containing protein [Fundidesulfovibrio putealis]
MITEHFLRKLLRALLPLISIVLAGCHIVAARHPLQGRDTGKEAVIRFSYLDKGADSVCVTGDFNGWSTTADCLSKQKSGFALEKRFGPGRYKYQLIIDSKTMIHDPRAIISEDDGFGGKNSVLVVE